MKRCQHCKQLKNETAFHRNRARPDGLSATCKTCRRDLERTPRRLAYNREYYAAHVDKKREQSRNYWVGHKKEKRDYKLSHEYGLSTSEFNVLLEKQHGKCAICGNPMARPHVDHCHETGAVRGLLCRECNLLLGHCHDDPQVLQSAASYLAGH